MNPMKLQLLEEILSHLSDSQAGGLKSLLDESKNPSPVEGSPEEEQSESSEEAQEEGDKPKGLAIEKVSLMDKPKDHMQEALDDASSSMDKKGSDEEMSDEELEELLKKLV